MGYMEICDIISKHASMLNESKEEDISILEEEET